MLARALLIAAAIVALAPAGAAASSQIAGPRSAAAPIKCTFAPCGLTPGSASRPPVLANSPHHDTKVSPHVVHVGQRITVTVSLTKVSGPRPALLLPPCNDNLAFAPRDGDGDPKAGATSLTCTYRATGLTPGWMAHDYTSSVIPDQDYYAIVPNDEFELSGKVSINGVPPAKAVQVRIRREGGGSRTVPTGPDGRYGAILKKGKWTVAPLGVPGASPETRTVKLTRDERKVDFTVKDAAPKVEWAMAERAGIDERPLDRVVDSFTRPQDVDPSSWTVNFTVATPEGKPCDPNAIYTFKVDGKKASAQRENECVFSVDDFPKQDTYKVAVTVRKQGGKDSTARKLTVRVRDFLIAVLGDSVASGEGNPDIPGFPTSWQDAQCDRSAFAFGPQAAIRLEIDDPHTSVTLVHLACSGGQVVRGILEPFEGLHPTGTDKPAQLRELRSLVRDREIDALVMSAGANDVFFGPVAERCIIPQPQTCFDTKFTDAGATMAEAVLDALDHLPKRYARLAKALEGLVGLVSPKRVYQTEYFDPTRGFNGTDFCTGYGGFDATEFRWAHDTIMQGLNLNIRRNAQRYDWTAVRGIAAMFARHGLCFETADRWIRTLDESLALQFTQGAPDPSGRHGVPDPSGTLHPNYAGHQAIADVLERKLRADLYDGDEPRKLRKR